MVAHTTGVLPACQSASTRLRCASGSAAWYAAAGTPSTQSWRARSLAVSRLRV
jgi:hypothetical protein